MAICIETGIPWQRKLSGLLSNASMMFTIPGTLQLSARLILMKKMERRFVNPVGWNWGCTSIFFSHECQLKPCLSQWAGTSVHELSGSIHRMAASLYCAWSWSWPWGQEPLSPSLSPWMPFTGRRYFNLFPWRTQQKQNRVQLLDLLFILVNFHLCSFLLFNFLRFIDFYWTIRYI